MLKLLQVCLKIFLVDFSAVSVAEEQSCLNTGCGAEASTSRSLLQKKAVHVAAGTESWLKIDESSTPREDPPQDVEPVPSPSDPFEDEDSLMEFDYFAQSPTPASPSPWVPEPPNPITYEVRGTDQPLNAVGFEAKINECCMTGMDAWLRQYLDSIDLEICHEGGYSGALTTINCNGTFDFSLLNSYLKSESEWKCPYLRPAGACPVDPDPVWPEDCPTAERESCMPKWHRRRACVRRRTVRTERCCAPDSASFLAEKASSETVALNRFLADASAAVATKSEESSAMATPSPTTRAAVSTTMPTMPTTKTTKTTSKTTTTTKTTTTKTTTTTTTTTITTTTITTTTYPTSPSMPSFIERFKCNGIDINKTGTGPDGNAVNITVKGPPIGPAQIFGVGTTRYEAAKLDVWSGAYYPLFEIPLNRTSPPFTYLNACGINPKDDLLYCVAIVDAKSYLVRVDEVRIEFVAKLPEIKFNSGDFGRNGVVYFTTFSAQIFQATGVAGLVGVSHQNDPALADLSSLSSFQLNNTGGFADMVMIYDDLIGTGVPEEFGLVLNSKKLIIMKLNGEKIQYWYAPVTGLRGKTTNFGAGWVFSGHVFFSSNDGLGVFEIPIEEIFLYDCKDNLCPTVTLTMVGKSDRTNRNDGVYCYGGSNPWATSMKPFNCSSVAGVMKAKKSNTGYDIMGLNITTGKKISVLKLPFNRTNPPYTSLTSLSLNPKDDVFYGVIVIGNQPYLVRLDTTGEAVEFVVKLRISSGGYVGGSFSGSGNFFYNTLTDPPRRIDVRGVAKIRGFLDRNDPELKDKSRDRGNVLADSTGASPTGMSGLVTFTGNLEGEGDSADYVIGIDGSGNLVVTKDNCSHYETWLVPTSSTPGGTSFGAAYTFDNKLFFEKKDGSGTFQVPMTGFNVMTARQIQLKLVGSSQDQGGSDVAGNSEEGINCLKSPPPFTVGENDCQLGYHEVAAVGGAGSCPAGAVLMFSLSKDVGDTRPGSHHKRSEASKSQRFGSRYEALHTVSDCPEGFD